MYSVLPTSHPLTLLSHTQHTLTAANTDTWLCRADCQVPGGVNRQLPASGWWGTRGGAVEDTYLPLPPHQPEPAQHHCQPQPVQLHDLTGHLAAFTRSHSHTQPHTDTLHRLNGKWWLSRKFLENQHCSTSSHPRLLYIPEWWLFLELGLQHCFDVGLNNITVLTAAVCI